MYNVWARYSLFSFFCLVKLFLFLLFVRISTIMVNKDEYIYNFCTMGDIHIGSGRDDGSNLHFPLTVVGVFTTFSRTTEFVVEK